jgi:hypothetical protein
MKQEIESIGLAYTSHSPKGRDTNRLKTIVRERCNDVERQNLFSKMSGKISLVFLLR